MDKEKKGRKVVVISIDVSPELHDLVTKAAEASEQTKAAWVRGVLRRAATAKLAKAKEEDSE